MSAPVAEAQSAVDIDYVAAAIAAAPDPAAITAYLVQSVAVRAPSAAAQGQLLSAVKTACDRVLKAVRESLLSSIDSEPGVYEGFVVFSRSGSRTIDYDKLQARYPDAYDELVRTGNDVVSIKYTG
ncbi:MAG: hypothetical protein WAV90_13715 [Gordonia amarae]